MFGAIDPHPAALIVGHPGHELRLFHWLETAHPLVCAITDGSGSGRSRIASSIELLRATGSTPGPVLGAFTDIEIYDAIIELHVEPVAAATEAIARALIDHGVRCVVADAFEFYNPTHDLCSVIASLATARAQDKSGSVMERYDYAITTATPENGVVVHLDDATVERKIAAAYRFDNLMNDVDDLLARVGKDDLAREVLRPVSTSIALPVPLRKPSYETRGEARVHEGRYRTVLRYEEHFVRFAEALCDTFGYPIGAASAPAASS